MAVVVTAPLIRMTFDRIGARGVSILRVHYGVVAASVLLPALGLGLGFLLEGPGPVQVTPLLVFLPCLVLGAVLSVPACVLGVVAIRRGRRSAYPGTALAGALVLFWVWFLFVFPHYGA